MKVRVTFDDDDIHRAIDAGLKKVDLYRIAVDDLIVRDDLVKFMKAAVRKLAAPADTEGATKP